MSPVTKSCTLAIGLLLLLSHPCVAQYDWFQQYPTPVYGRLQGLHFTDTNTGMIVGDVGCIYRTTDGGDSWTFSQDYMWIFWNDVFCIDENKAIIVGDKSWILRTTDGGESWIEQHQDVGAEFNAVWFSDSLTGTVVGNGGVILRTTDGGVNWTPQSSWTGEDLHGVSFFDANIGIVTGNNEYILHTTDGGTNWIMQHNSNPLCAPPLVDVAATSPTNGIAVGMNGRIFRTTNAGATWEKIEGGTRKDIGGVSFSDQDHGTIVASGGTILHTTDGGERWERETSGIIRDLYGVCFTARNIGTAIGGNGTVIRKELDPSTSTDDLDAVPRHARLMPNHPNPFGNVTSISFTLDRAEHVSLYVVDGFGRMVTTLLDERRDPGMHAIDWAAAGVSCGVYFCVLRIGEFTESRRMIHVRAMH